MRTVATLAVVLPVFPALGRLRRLLTGLTPWVGGAVALLVMSAWTLVLATAMDAGRQPPALTIAGVASGAVSLSVIHHARRGRETGQP